MRLAPWLAGAGAWLALAAITATQNYAFAAWLGRPLGVWPAIWRELVVFGAWAALTPPIVLAARWIRRRGRRALALHAPLAVAFAVAHAAILVLALTAIEGPRPPGFGEQVWAMLGRAFVIDVVFYGAIVLATLAVAWAAAYRRRDAESALLEADLARARLDALRAQLQPHFLFNSLHAASSLIDTDPAGARRALVVLSDLLRATLDLRTPSITLADELALLDSYLELQRLRFRDRLGVTIDVPDELRTAAVPPLILQPLVENAIRHGIGARPEAGAIAITARREHDRLRLSVADDGVGLAERREERVGLGTTRARLATLYGAGASLELVPRTGGGAESRLELPLGGAR